MAGTSTGSIPVPMPPANSDLGTTWAYLEEGVDHIMTKLQSGVSYSKYMSLYTVSYNYCTSSKMHGSGEAGPGALGHRSAFTCRDGHALLIRLIRSSWCQSNGI